MNCNKDTAQRLAHGVRRGESKCVKWLEEAIIVNSDALKNDLTAVDFEATVKVCLASIP